MFFILLFLREHLFKKEFLPSSRIPLFQEQFQVSYLSCVQQIIYGHRYRVANEYQIKHKNYYDSFSWSVGLRERTQCEVQYLAQKQPRIFGTIGCFGSDEISLKNGHQTYLLIKNDVWWWPMTINPLNEMAWLHTVSPLTMKVSRYLNNGFFIASDPIKRIWSVLSKI